MCLDIDEILLIFYNINILVFGCSFKREVEKMGKVIKSIGTWIKENIVVIAVVIFIVVILQSLIFKENHDLNHIATAIALLCLLVIIRGKTSSKVFKTALLFIAIMTSVTFIFFEVPLLIGAIMFTLFALMLCYIKKIMLSVLAVAICTTVGFFIVQFAEGKAGTAGSTYSTNYFISHAMAMDIGTTIGGIIAFSVLGSFMLLVVSGFLFQKTKKSK